ncbi:MAG TPA: SprB repeat-containing protein, partial [Flavobacteriales bacterium]|nr:SprB repeat-containing protein [Flavobacteriales bacterium]
IPLMVDAAITGTYTVTASGMENIGLTCLVLEDLLTGTITPLVEGASYSFTMEANASTTEPRLKLHASVPVPLYAENTTCSTTQDGRGTVVHVGNGPMDITWTNAEGTIEDGVAINNDLAPGSYGVTVSSEAGCGALSTSFTINAPTALEVEATSAFASCPNTTDGRVDLTVLGGTAPYTFNWSNGSSDEDLVAAAGAYTVTITDSNGCTVFTPE